MNNKLIISALVLFLSLGVMAQDNTDNVVSPELNFTETRLDPNNKIELYPNPAVKYLIIEIKNNTLENAEFEMHSIIGNEIVVKPEEIGSGKYRISVEDITTGYYFLVVKDERSRFKKAFKFLKN